MSQKNLSVFIDESGDFGSYESHAPFYIVSMVLHDQQIDIDENISDFETHMQNMVLKNVRQYVWFVQMINKSQLLLIVLIEQDR